ncbi:Crp/Fnr family transcriptional regulator [Halopseudomonas phragmitis]|uniref:Crp/Fnr family transcriptional regulator n=1 Tax=Halopseudomonas phragmitis TaxID=1931241 RepID=A0A1V0B3G6_9GAMM|nr:Crp/Fnr family transcriptional regulator [Halopseudomonas phragmitis]AQZ94445.1 Crp/Fnr family transcriptional regulator [Halopseudomonas phragmitis]
MQSQPVEALDVTGVLNGNAWFAGLPDELRNWLVAHSRLFSLAAGERLFARGDAPDGLYCVGSGLLRLTGITEGGQEAILAVVGAPHWFGEIALFDNAPRTHDAWAETDVVLVHVPQKELARLLTEKPTYWQIFGQLLTQKLRSAFVLMEDLLLLAPQPRVARRLALMATGYDTLQGRSRRVLRVTQEQLASMLALSRQTVNLALRELEAAGLIRRLRGAVEILDLSRLQQSVSVL